MDAASVRVSEAFHLCPSLDVLIPALREGGLAELERRCTLKAGKIFSRSHKANGHQSRLLLARASPLAQLTTNSDNSSLRQDITEQLTEQELQSKCGSREPVMLVHFETNMQPQPGKSDSSITSSGFVDLQPRILSSHESKDASLLRA